MRNVCRKHRCRQQPRAVRYDMLPVSQQVISIQDLHPRQIIIYLPLPTIDIRISLTFNLRSNPLYTKNENHSRQHAVRYGTGSLHAFLPFYKDAVSTETGLRWELYYLQKTRFRRATCTDSYSMFAGKDQRRLISRAVRYGIFVENRSIPAVNPCR